jgi:hypothetical protein
MKIFWNRKLEKKYKTLFLGLFSGFQQIRTEGRVSEFHGYESSPGSGA